MDLTNDNNYFSFLNKNNSAKNQDPTVSKKNLFSNMMDNPVSYNNPGINALLNLQRTISVNADAQGNQNFFQKRFTTAKAD